MRFTEFDFKKIKRSDLYKFSKNIRLLDEFKKSGLKCAKVTDWTCKCADYCASSIQQTIKKKHNEYKDIICIGRNGEVFLINEAVDE